MGNYDYGGRKAEGAKPFSGYACKYVTISGTSSDYSLRDNTTLFDIISNPVQVLIRNGSQNIMVKFNNLECDLVRISANADFGVDSFVINDIYVTVSGVSDASMDIFTLGWN